MKYLLYTTLVLSVMLAGCGTSTKVTGSWKARNDTTYHFNKIVVLGITPKAEGRRLVEDKMESFFRENGISAIGALDFLPPNANQENISLEIIKAYFDIEKNDAVLTVSLLRVKNESRYSSGRYIYYPTTNSYFGDYYGNMSNYVWASGYYSASQTIFLECNLYDYPEGNLLWSGQTQTIDMSSLEKGAESVAHAVVSNLLKTQVIK